MIRLREKTTLKRQYQKRQVFVKITAGILALLMVAGVGISLVYSLMA